MFSMAQWSGSITGARSQKNIQGGNSNYFLVVLKGSRVRESSAANVINKWCIKARTRDAGGRRTDGRRTEDGRRTRAPALISQTRRIFLCFWVRFCFCVGVQCWDSASRVHQTVSLKPASRGGGGGEGGANLPGPHEPCRRPM